ncbi:MAG: hypothetical protein RIS50_1639, partial [Bacteroidota bacterium]
TRLYFQNSTYQNYPVVGVSQLQATAYCEWLTHILNESPQYASLQAALKKHGLKNQVEGEMLPGDKIVLVEDLISTGKSSFQAVEGVHNAGATVVGVVALFTYGFANAMEKFVEAGIPVYTLTNLPTLTAVAAEHGFIQPSELETVNRFAQNPAAWGENL